MQSLPSQHDSKELPALFQDIQRNDLYAIKRTLTANAGSLRQRTRDSRTPLHAAVLTGNPAVVRELLHHGASVDGEDAFGNSALHLACEQGSLAVVKELLANQEHRDVVQKKNKDGVTPLHLAAQVGMRDVVLALVERGARADVKDNMGRTPMDMVNPENHPVIQMLIAAGAHIGRPSQGQLSRRASQKAPGSSVSVPKLVHSASQGPGSPTAIRSSMSSMGMPSPAQSPRVSGTVPGAAQLQVQVLQQGSGSPGQPGSPTAAAANGVAMRTSQGQVSRPSAGDMSGPLLHIEMRDIQARVAKLDAFFQAQIDLIPEWQKALGMIQNYKRMLDEHEQRISAADTSSKEASNKADKVDGQLQELQQQQQQHWQAYEAAQRSMQTSIHKISHDQQQLQAALSEMADLLGQMESRRADSPSSSRHAEAGSAEVQRLRSEMDQLLRSNLATGLDEVRAQLSNSIRIQSQLAQSCADLEDWRRALDADMPQALEGIKHSVVTLQQEMELGRVLQLQNELGELAAEVGSLRKEHAKGMADTVMGMLDHAALCLTDHDKQIVDMRQQVAALEEVVVAQGGGGSSDGKVEAMGADLQALQVQLVALMRAFDEHKETADAAQERLRSQQEQSQQQVEQQLQQLQKGAKAASVAGSAAVPAAQPAAGLSVQQLQEVEQQMVERLQQLQSAHDSMQSKVQQLEGQYSQLQAYVESALQQMPIHASPAPSSVAGSQQQSPQQQGAQASTPAAAGAKAASPAPAGSGQHNGSVAFDIEAAHSSQQLQQQPSSDAGSQRGSPYKLNRPGSTEVDDSSMLPGLQQGKQQAATDVPIPVKQKQPKCCVIM